MPEDLIEKCSMIENNLVDNQGEEDCREYGNAHANGSEIGIRQVVHIQPTVLIRFWESLSAEL